MGKGWFDLELHFLDLNVNAQQLARKKKKKFKLSYQPTCLQCMFVLNNKQKPVLKDILLVIYVAQKYF